MKSESPRAAAHDAGHDLTNAAPRAAWLSALADGDASAAQQACAAWRDDAESRQTWHTYHLIGDVMRSEELASRPARDAAFLAGIRARLAHEPVVLAPTEPVAARARRRPVWLMPAAAAAGFVVVAGVLVVARVGMPGAPFDGTGMASVQSRQGSGLQVVNDVPRKAPVLIRSEGVLRDARLDEYLRAHQAARGGVAVASPGGAFRRVDAEVPARVER